MHPSQTRLLTRIGLLAVIFLLVSGSAWSDELATGDDAPPFSLPGSDGKTHSLSEHVGERAVVIAWFPKAFTGG